MTVCCHIENEIGETIKHSDQVFELFFDSSPDGSTLMCSIHVGDHLNLDRETTVYPFDTTQ